MALQAGMGLSRILVLMGAGYTGTILIKSGKLSDLIGELQALVKGLEKSGDAGNTDSDPIAAQVRWLAQEVRQLASSRQITVVNGSSGRTDITSFIVPGATVCALGYGYMWWKGLSFSDLMYVTKRNMAAAVENLTKHLEGVSEKLAQAKRHLTQRIENLDGKVDEQREMSKLIMNEVRDTRGDIDKVTSELFVLRDTVFSLEDKMCLFEDKQALTLAGVEYLCQFVDGKAKKLPEVTGLLQDHTKGSGKSRGQLPSSNPPVLQGLQDILSESMTSKREVKSIANGDSSDQSTRNLMRTVSAKTSNF